MAIFVKFITHDVVNNTLEVAWHDNADPAREVSVKVRNYAPLEKATFLADLNTFGAAPFDGTKWTTLARW